MTRRVDRVNDRVGFPNYGGEVVFFFFFDQVGPLKHNFNASSAAVRTAASYQNPCQHSFSARNGSIYAATTNSIGDECGFSNYERC